MSKHFCCCIPVRAGVFIFSLLAFLSSAFVAGVMWFFLHEVLTGGTDFKESLKDVDFSKVTKGGKIAVIVAASVFTIVALIALFGFLGSVFRKRKMVKAYSVLSWITFFIYFVASGLYFYLIFSGRNLFNGCEVTDTNGETHECRIDLKVWQKVISVLIVLTGLFIHLYIAVVIRRYVDQLEDEHDYSHEYKLAKNKNNASTYEPTYYPPTAQDPAAAQGLLHTNNAQYPYTDAAHSFGNHSHA
ncbi:hypothetical protein QCA50_007152 [Cerrena zonata]|uniref:Uncharacterized protein n=1 Tax=Cerrena zonata TaxID=2478898 RepID=A0AAW0G7Q3_9APHY